MKPFIFALLTFAVTQELPYKPKEEFEIKLDFQFRQRPSGDKTAIHFDETQKEHDRRTSSAVLPYLILNVKVLTVSEDEKRVRVTNNKVRVHQSKKIEAGTVIPIDLGFTDDVKDRITAHQYDVTFVSADKKELSMIRILVEEDGTFLVNGEKRGKL